MSYISYAEWESLGLQMSYWEWHYLKQLFPNITPGDIPNLNHDPQKVVHWAPSRNFAEKHAVCGFDTNYKAKNCVYEIYVDLEESVTCPVCLFKTYMRWIHGHERQDGSWRIGFLLDPESVTNNSYHKLLAQVARFFNQQRQAGIEWDCVANQAAPHQLSTLQHHESPVDTVPDEALTWDALCQLLEPVGPVQ